MRRQTTSSPDYHNQEGQSWTPVEADGRRIKPGKLGTPTTGKCDLPGWLGFVKVKDDLIQAYRNIRNPRIEPSISMFRVVVVRNQAHHEPVCDDAISRTDSEDAREAFTASSVTLSDDLLNHLRKTAQGSSRFRSLAGSRSGL